MNRIVLQTLGGIETGPGKKWSQCHSFDELDPAAIFKLFSHKFLLLKVCSGMDIGILRRSADFLSALFLKMRHEAAHEASTATSYSHCLVVLFSSGCIMQLIRNQEGALCNNYSLMNMLDG
jgi:hypothetical protein